MRSLSQGHSDGHALVAMPLTEPSLPPLRSGADVFAKAFHGNHCKTHMRSTKMCNLVEH